MDGCRVRDGSAVCRSGQAGWAVKGAWTAFFGVSKVRFDSVDLFELTSLGCRSVWSLAGLLWLALSSSLPAKSVELFGRADARKESGVGNGRAMGLRVGRFKPESYDDHGRTDGWSRAQVQEFGGAPGLCNHAGIPTICAAQRTVSLAQVRLPTLSLCLERLGHKRAPTQPAMGAPRLATRAANGGRSVTKWATQERTPLGKGTKNRKCVQSLLAKPLPRPHVGY